MNNLTTQLKRLQLLTITLLLLQSPLLLADESQPIFDVHLHYKWDQEEATKAKQAIQILDSLNIKKAIVIGLPADYALKLYTLAPEKIIPFYSPYTFNTNKMSWLHRKGLLSEARKGLESGIYKGIGELHLLGGVGVNWKRSQVFVSLLALAKEFNVPLMIHTEYVSIKPLLSMCEENPDNRFLIAHAGAIIPPQKVQRVLASCANVMLDLAARDPWRYVNNPITNKQGLLLDEWRKVILLFPKRFMIGSDPVWPVDKGSNWDEPDTGWVELPKYIKFHQRWLSDLPKELYHQIIWLNALNWINNKT